MENLPLHHLSRPQLVNLLLRIVDLLSQPMLPTPRGQVDPPLEPYMMPVSIPGMHLMLPLLSHLAQSEWGPCLHAPSPSHLAYLTRVQRHSTRWLRGLPLHLTVDKAMALSHPLSLHRDFRTLDRRSHWQGIMAPSRSQ